MRPFDDSDRYRRMPGLLVRELEGEAVLLDVASSRYFGLNETGQRILALCDGEHTVAEIVRLLEAEFAVSGPVRDDLAGLLEQLEREGIVERLAAEPER